MAFTTDYFGTLAEEAISHIEYPTVAPALYEPIRYTLAGGGKRLRPMLTLAVYEALSRRPAQEAINQAIAVELFHNFTLLHDDVMDRAELRRGRPTVHCRWNDNVAILSGDAMLTLAAQYLARCSDAVLPALNRCFNDTAMGVYQGQQLDIDFESRNDVTVDEYIEMIRLKTSVLLEGACALGAILAGADEAMCQAFAAYGLNLGLAFQLRDDWLDTFGDAAIFGKEIGGDIINRKKTWLLITALNEAPERIVPLLESDLPATELVKEVTRVYNSLYLGRRCSDLAKSYSDKAISSIEGLEIDVEARKFFIDLAQMASTRKH